MIQQQYVRTLRGKIGPIEEGAKVVAGARVDDDMRARLVSYGFPDPLTLGDSVLPTVMRRATKFNANGREVPDRTKPKERCVRQAEWSWEMWHGPHDTETETRIVDIPYFRFPRIKTPPPGIELRIAPSTEGEPVLVAPAVEFAGEDDPRLIHAVNLILEVAGVCEVFSSDLRSIIQAPLRRLNWNLLPPGRRPWEQLQREVEEVVQQAKKGNQPVVKHRLEVINEFEPDFFALGRAGFAGYIVFGFPNRKLFLMESVFTGNATYVFDENWERLSRRTKAEVIQDGLHVDRIIHVQGWDSQIRELLSRKPTRRSA